MDTQQAKQTFTEIYNKEANSIFRYCLFRVHEREKAIDIVQDIFAEFWKKINTGEKIKSEKAYLFTLAHNRIIDWYRKKKTESLDDLLENTDTERPFDHPDEHSEADIMLSSEAKEVLREIDKLEPVYKEVLFLRFAEDLSPQEIAMILDITPNTASVRITRGIEKLKEKFHTQNK